MRQARTLFAAFLLTCGGSAYVPHGYLEPEARKMRIVGAEVYISSQQWQQSPYFRIAHDPVDLPIFVLIDNRNMGCLVPPEVWALSPQYAACPTGWRHPRPRY